MSFSTILHKRSSTPNAVPSSGSLSAGELAINTADGKLFAKTVGNTVETFLNANQQPYTLDTDLSSVNFQYGGNTVTGVLAAVLGGVDNDVSGAGSTVINGSDNDIAADYAIIGNGSNNTILTGGDFGGILAGQNNTLNHENSFIIGSNITSHAANFTYTNNLSVLGSLYGDGSNLTGIVAGDSEATTLVRSNSATWDSTYTIVQSNSSNWGGVDIVLTSNPLKFVFIGDGSTTNFAVSGTANSENASLIEVFVDSVRQEPTTSYLLSADVVTFSAAPSLNSRIVVITPNTIAGQLSVAKRHEFVDQNTYSIVYAAIAPFGTTENNSLWRITKIVFTDTGSVSTTQYANNVAWSDRLTTNYS